MNAFFSKIYPEHANDFINQPDYFYVGYTADFLQRCLEWCETHEKSIYVYWEGDVFDLWPYY
jgi:hypothetical protein